MIPICKKSFIMNIEDVRDFCLHVPAAEETQPFGEQFVVYKVMGSMFSMLDLYRPDLVSLKCNADWSLELRDRYEGIEPAWHMNKKYWNQVWFDRDVDDDLLCRLILHSRDEVVKKWSKKKQEEYAKLISAE